MLANRVILGLTFDSGVLTRTKLFRPDYRYTQAWSWSADADELVLIDVTHQPTPETNTIFLGVVEKYCRDSGLPMTVANHIRSAEDAKPLFDRGADRVLVSHKRMGCYEEIAGRWGSNALVAGIDYEGNWPIHVGPLHRPVVSGIMSDRGVETGLDRFKEATRRGTGEILLTDISRDGSLLGYDLPTLRACCAATTTPILIQGGCGNDSHFKEAFEAGAAGAVTNRIFSFSPTALRHTKDWLLKNYDGVIRP